MAGNVPPRHGIEWGRNAPTRISERSIGELYGQKLPAPAPSAQPVALVGRVPVSVVDAFYQALPELTLQPIIKTIEGQYTLTQIDPDVVAPIRFAFFTVPDGYVYIITDVIYYATTPSRHLNAPPVCLSAEQLAGLARFDLTFGNRQTARFDVATISPYANPGTPAPASLTGWPFVGTPFGPQRTTGFAIYARSQQEILVVVTFDVLPQFPIVKLGAHMHGYAVPEASFERMFSRRRID